MSSNQVVSRQKNLARLKLMWQRYGAHRPPFSSHVNFDSFLPTKNWHLQYQAFKDFLSTHKSPFLLLSGVAGTGRYSLLEQMLHCSNYAGRQLHISADRSTTFESIVRNIRLRWHGASSNTTLSCGPYDYADLLFSKAGVKKQHLIIIDHADNLPMVTLAGLIACFAKNQQHMSDHTPRVVFICSPDFYKNIKMQLIDPPKDFITHISIPLMSEQEAFSYIQHRILRSGVDPRYRLQQRSVAQLVRRGGGKVAIINRLAKQYLPSDLFEKKAKVSVKANKKEAYKKLAKKVNHFVVYQGIWAIGVVALGYVMLSYQPHINVRHIFLTSIYPAPSLQKQQMLAMRRSDTDVFAPDSGYSLDKPPENNSAGDDIDANPENFSMASVDSVPTPAPIEIYKKTYGTKHSAVSRHARHKYSHKVNYDLDENI